jgi:uncharacterized protein (TIGR03437 family)
MAYTAAATTTSIAKTTGSAQTFTSGAAVSITSGVNSGSAFAVVEPIWDLYNLAGGPPGQLGFPTSNDVTLPDGSHRQTFEAGRIVYTVGNTPTILFPVNEVDLFPVATTTLQYGQTLTVTASLYDNTGQVATGRTVSWSTSNSGAVSITPSGYTAVLKGVGSGSANITATSEGIVSKALVVSAVEPCCQVGQGAPTPAIQAAFQAAVARNKLAVLVPAATAVRQLGGGYVQDLYSPDGVTHYLVAEAATSQTAYVVTGAILTAYTANGGPAGPIAYPTADADSGGTQLFQGGALAGNPVQTVTGAILTKWAANQYETGPLGAPTAAQASFKSVSGYTGYSQAFAGGAIFGISGGAYAGQGFISNGPILALYLSLSGPAGELGIPTGDPTVSSGVTRQNFENGYIDLQPGAGAAVEHLNPRVPSISVTPSTVLQGNRVHISINGFNNNASLTVSQTGQANFVVSVPSGSYQWDAYIASNAASGVITIKAVDSTGSSTATGAYTVRSIAAAQPELQKYQGDNQTGPPGSVLPTLLTVALTDSSNAPIAGATVTFSASPGAAVTPAAAVTDSNGRAAASLRLPASPGVAAVTAQALGNVAIFDAAASGSFVLPNYPNFVATTPTGAQVAAAASMIRYYQNSGSMSAANGQATPAALSQFLQTIADGYLNSSQLVNFWRLTNFTGSGITVSAENTDLDTIRTLTAAGDPVLLNLALTQDATPAGGEAVVATGIASDGSVTILDPSSTFAQVNLNGYLGGFVSSGHFYQAQILSALRLLPKAPAATGFLVDSISQPIASPSLSVQSAAGSCGSPLQFQDAFAAGSPLPNPILISQVIYCDGSQSVYQAAITASSASLIDLASTPGTGSSPLTNSSYQLSRSSGQWKPAAAVASFDASSVLNAATFQPGLSPGGIFSLFGASLAGSASATTVSVGGTAAKVLLATPFQINAQVPATATPGSTTLQVASPYGTVSQAVTLQAAAPGIFVIGTATDGTSSLGAVVNQTGVVNGPTAPAVRGSTVAIYCTGLGATTAKNGLSVTNATVGAVLSNTALPAAFAGLTPGFFGLYQVNLQIPANTPPGLLLPLSLRVAAAGGNVSSNTVVISVQ